MFVDCMCVYALKIDTYIKSIVDAQICEVLLTQLQLIDSTQHAHTHTHIHNLSLSSTHTHARAHTHAHIHTHTHTHTL